MTLCYVMLCYAMLCYAMLCYAMLCYAMLCYAMLCYVMLCYVMSCCVRPCCVWRPIGWKLLTYSVIIKRVYNDWRNRQVSREQLSTKRLYSSYLSEILWYNIFNLFLLPMPFKYVNKDHNASMFHDKYVVSLLFPQYNEAWNQNTYWYWIIK